MTKIFNSQQMGKMNKTLRVITGKLKDDFISDEYANGMIYELVGSMNNVYFYHVSNQHAEYECVVFFHIYKEDINSLKEFISMVKCCKNTWSNKSFSIVRFALSHNKNIAIIGRIIDEIIPIFFSNNFIDDCYANHTVKLLYDKDMKLYSKSYYKLYSKVVVET